MAVARGDKPADLVVTGGKVLSVFTKEWLEVDVAITDGHVVGLGRYEGGERMDAAGAYLVPGFIDAHMHIESSKLTVDEFARAVLAHGTTAVVADPHEIANVLGTDGIHWLLDSCAALPLDVFVMASSCVPASRFESPHRPFTTGDIESTYAFMFEGRNGTTKVLLEADFETSTFDKTFEPFVTRWNEYEADAFMGNLKARFELVK